METSSHRWTSRFLREPGTPLFPPVVGLFRGGLRHAVLDENEHFIFGSRPDVALAVSTPPLWRSVPEAQLLSLDFISDFHSCPFSEPHSSVSLGLTQPLQ